MKNLDLQAMISLLLYVSHRLYYKQQSRIVGFAIAKDLRCLLDEYGNYDHHISTAKGK